MRAFKREKDTLKEVDLPLPSPGPNEVLLEVKAAGLNPVDRKAFSTGVDGAGLVCQLGENVTGVQQGERVMFHSSLKAMREGRPVGSFAEYAVIDADALVRIPANLSFIEAASIPCPGGTAVQIRDRLRGLPVDLQNENVPARIVIRGAAGAVGTFLVQLLAIEQPRTEILAIASAENSERLKAAGAKYVIPYNEGEAAVRSALSALTGESEPKFDAVVNLISTSGAAKDSELVGNGGIVVSVIGRPDMVREAYPLNASYLERAGKNPWEEAIVRPSFSSPLTLVEIALGSAYSTGARDVRRMARCYQEATQLVGERKVLLPDIETISFVEIPTVLFGKRTGKFVAEIGNSAC